MKLCRVFLAIVFVLSVSNSACPAGPVRYIRSGPFQEPAAGVGDFFYLFTDHYDHVGYLSPDMPTFLSFGQWSGIKDNRPNIFLILDVPEDISVHGGRFVDLISEEKLAESSHGGPYKRYRIHFTYGKAVTRSGMTQLLCTTRLATGTEVTLFYGTEMAGVVRHGQVLPVKIIDIPKPGCPAKLFTFFDTFSPCLEIYPDLGDLRDLGFNRIGGLSIEGRALSTLVKKSAEAGLELMSWNTERGGIGSYSGEWRAKNMDGRYTNAISPAYRGPALQGWIDSGDRLADSGVYIHVTDPERNDGEKICFSEESLRRFREYLGERRPDLQFVDPVEFTAKPQAFPEHMQAWTDFKSENYAGLYRYYRNAVEDHMKKGKDGRLRLMIYAQPGYGSLKMSDAVRSSNIYTVRTSLQDPLKLSGVFDIFSPMIYIDVNGRREHRVDMLEVPDEVQNLRKYLGKRDLLIAPALSAGFPHTVFRSEIPPGSVMRYQVLEAFAGGAKGVGVYSEGFFDALEMKQFAEAIGRVLPVEEILMKGEPVPSGELLDLNRETFVKGVKDEAGNAVILVSEYSEERRTARVRYAGTGAAFKVYDLAGFDAAGAEPLPEKEKNVFEVALAGDRARLFFVRVDK